MVAEHASIWHSFSDAETLERKLGILAGHCSDVDRDPAAIEISVELGRKSAAEADELRDLGASLFTIGLTGPEYDLAPVRDWLAWRDGSH